MPILPMSVAYWGFLVVWYICLRWASSCCSKAPSLANRLRRRCRRQPEGRMTGNLSRFRVVPGQTDVVAR
uniref:Putative secreted protein n=1 Tax=Ixodes ricinus TaxID=34613 RepID=A0A147BTU7_IXORI